MLILNHKNNKFSFSLLSNPLPRVLKFQKLIHYFKQIPKGHSVLDYGSGDRPYKKLFLTKFREYIAADFPATNIKHSIKPDISIDSDGLINLPSASVDCVILTEVLEHLYKPDSVLKEIYRLLKFDGILVGTVPFVVQEHEQPFDFHRYTYYCLKKMFEDSEFEIIHLEYVGERIAVAITVFNSVLQIFVKTLRKIKIEILADLLNCIIKIPEFIYLYLKKAGVDVQKVKYFKALPLGYSFYLRKK